MLCWNLVSKVPGRIFQGLLLGEQIFIEFMQVIIYIAIKQYSRFQVMVGLLGRRKCFIFVCKGTLYQIATFHSSREKVSLNMEK